MKEINKQNQDHPYPVLDESDYEITVIDQGAEYFGGIHHVNMSEHFEIAAPMAIQVDSPISEELVKGRNTFAYVNDEVDNNTCILIFGNSFLANYILDDIAESFHRTIFVWDCLDSDFMQLIDECDPQIVLSENTQRYKAFNGIIRAAKKVAKHS